MRTQEETLERVKESRSMKIPIIVLSQILITIFAFVTYFSALSDIKILEGKLAESRRLASTPSLKNVNYSLNGPDSISFYGPGSEWVVVINSDGTVTHKGDIKEAAHAFWRALNLEYPNFIRDLRDEVLADNQAYVSFSSVSQLGVGNSDGITFSDEKDSWKIKVLPNGKVEYTGTLDEATLVFWKAIEARFPEFSKSSCSK